MEIVCHRLGGVPLWREKLIIDHCKLFCIMLSSLSKNILSTLCYYDVLDYPLTSFEIWKYLMSHNTEHITHSRLAEVIDELESSNLNKYIEELEGFYFLKGRKSLVEARLHKNKISGDKLKRLRRIVWFLRFVPYIRMIAATGTLAMKNAEKESDWDLLIVLKKGRIWTGRTLATFLLHIIGKRRYGDKIKNRVCLNYFITTNSLEIRTKDLFSANEYYFLLPLFDAGSYYKKFQLRNSWIKDFKLNYSLNEIMGPRVLVDSEMSSFIRTFLEKVFGWNFLEKRLGDWEKRKIENNPKTGIAGSYIQASDDALIFLPEPQGPKVFEEFKRRLEAFNI